MLYDAQNNEMLKTVDKKPEDAEKEYGYKLGPAEVNASTFPNNYYLEDEKGNRTEITNNEALEFIAKARMGNHVGPVDTYDNYTQLFNILGIEPKAVW